MNRANAAAHAASPGVSLLPRLAVLALSILLTPRLGSAGLNPVYQLTGSHVGGTFGQILGSPGDVNGDGYPDLLVGAPRFSTPRPGGEAYLFFGGADFDTIPDVVFDAGEFLLGVATRPTDLNGDGRPDIVLCGGGLGQAEVRVYFGRPQMIPTPDIVLPSPSSLWRIRVSIAGSVDVDGDGFSDLVVGWPAFEVVDGNSQRFGVVSIYRGGPTFDDVPDWKLESDHVFVGSQPGPLFGECVGPVGDFNGDGHADLGVYEASRFGSYPPFGHIYVYDGGPVFDTTPDGSFRAIFAPLSTPSRLFTPVGDVDGDGIDDMATQGSSFNSDTTFVSAGHNVWVYRGGTGATPWPPDAILAGPTDLSGPVFGDLDVTGDGRRDLVIGSSSPGANRVLVMETQPFDSQPDIEIVGAYPEFFGTDVAEVDVTGDGVSDLAVGAPWAATEIGAQVGRVAIYDVARPLLARAFLRGDHRVVALVPTESDIPATFRIQLEPVDGAFELSSVDPNSIRLQSPGTGDVDAISPIGLKTPRVGDTNGNGVPDLGIDFKRSDLGHLLALVRGRREVPVTLSGRLQNRRRFQASLTLMVVAGSGGDAASVEPNPLNPVGSIVFDMRRPGRVTAALYDVRGRRIRTLVDGQIYPQGPVRIPIDGRDEAGASLASGIYFYRIEAPDGSRRGRFVVAK